MRLKLLALTLVFAACSPEQAPTSYPGVGDGIPLFSVTMNDGSAVCNSDLADGISVVAFFHTRCSDCAEELPVLQRLYDDWSDKVRFVLVSRAETADDVQTYWEEQGFTMPYSAQKDRTVFELFAGSIIPRVYLCADGTIRKIWLDDPVMTADDFTSAMETIKTTAI